MTYFRSCLQLSMVDVEAAPVYVLDNTTGRRWPCVELSDHISLMPSPDFDLPAVLRRLAERVDNAMIAALDVEDSIHADDPRAVAT